MFLHGGEFLESESESIHDENPFGGVYPVTLVELDSYDEQDKEDQEA